MKNKIVGIVLISTFYTASSVKGEKFDLEVYASKFDSIPIGIVDFKQKGKETLTENLPADIIASDLDFCGRFIVVKRPTFDSAAFTEVGAGIYIDGEYEIIGEKIIIECFLRDVLNKELIISKKYKGELKFIRNMVHKYSNEIVEILFGERGIFESRIIYVVDDGKSKNIAIMDFDGYNQSKITNTKGINIFPVFADKSNILWVSYQNNNPDIFRGSIYSGASKIFIHSKGIETSPDVSPIDGTVVYASSVKGNLDIYTCGADGTNVKQLTTHYGVDTSPCWSPNGYYIAFTSDRSGNPQIYIMDADGANQRRLTFHSKYADSPAWSPKGDKIAYQSMDENGKFDIWLVGLEGTDPVKITNLEGNNEYPTWSPDGSLIAFVNIYGGRSDLYVIKADGSRLRRVTNSGNIKMPDWSDF